MRTRFTCVCLALLILALGATGCFGASGGSADASSQATTTAAPTTTTTLSPAQIALQTMTVRQKAAQVLLLAFSGASLSVDTSALLAAGPPGGLLVLGYNVTGSAEQVRALTTALQQAAAAAGSPVGLFIAIDQEGGSVQRISQGVPSLPSARKLGSSSTPTEASELARQTARDLLHLGINMNLAPVADVVADKKSFLFDRSYGGDAALVASYVTAVIQASQDEGLISVVKHFPGHGSAPADTHEEAAVSSADEQEFESVHLPPFRAAISAGVEGIMVAHVVATAYDAERPASLSPAVVTRLLIEQLGFEGLVVADDLSMAAALESAAQTKVSAEARAAIDALNAGCDLLILAELEMNSRAVLDALVSAVERGEVSQARLDGAVLKILDLKFRYGIIIAPGAATATTGPTKETTP